MRLAVLTAEQAETIAALSTADVAAAPVFLQIAPLTGPNVNPAGVLGEAVAIDDRYVLPAALATNAEALRYAPALAAAVAALPWVDVDVDETGGFIIADEDGAIIRDDEDGEPIVQDESVVT